MIKIYYPKAIVIVYHMLKEKNKWMNARIITRITKSTRSAVNYNITTLMEHKLVEKNNNLEFRLTPKGIKFAESASKLISVIPHNYASNMRGFV